MKLSRQGHTSLCFNEKKGPRSDKKLTNFLWDYEFFSRCKKTIDTVNAHRISRGANR